MEQRVDAIEMKVREVIKNVLQVNEEDILQESTIEDLGGDSLAALGIISELEQEFDLEIPDEAARKVDSFASAIEIVRKLVEQKGS
ncbi:MAG: acyl carrier protein [Nitrospirae bacterium]|nr:acyl carrier protein [Nitrospirota bacterium]